VSEETGLCFWCAISDFGYAVLSIAGYHAVKIHDFGGAKYYKTIGERTEIQNNHQTQQRTF